jgi:hypothetical protein
MDFITDFVILHEELVAVLYVLVEVPSKTLVHFWPPNEILVQRRLVPSMFLHLAGKVQWLGPEGGGGRGAHLVVGYLLLHPIFPQQGIQFDNIGVLWDIWDVRSRHSAFLG